LLAGRYGKESEVPTVAEMALELLEHIRLRRKFSTGIFYGLMLEKHIVPALGRLRLTEVTGERIDRFARSLTEGRKPKTVNNVLGVLGRLLRFSVARGALKVAPAVGKLTLLPGTIRFLSFAEAEQFIFAARESSNWTAQVIVALRTGLRIGELLALRWEDVDLAGLSSVAPSGSTSRAPRRVAVPAKSLFRTRLWRLSASTLSVGRMSSARSTGSAVTGTGARERSTPLRNGQGSSCPLAGMCCGTPSRPTW
jgi:integrase